METEKIQELLSKRITALEEEIETYLLQIQEYSNSAAGPHLTMLSNRIIWITEIKARINEIYHLANLLKIEL